MEFRQVNEKRWLIMKKIAFYILERPASEGKEESEFKEDETEGLAPVEVCSFCDYAKLLSVYSVTIETISLANCTHSLYTIVNMFLFIFNVNRTTGCSARTYRWTTHSPNRYYSKYTVTPSKRLVT